jgi:hypothetical protein
MANPRPLNANRRNHCSSKITSPFSTASVKGGKAHTEHNFRFTPESRRAVAAPACPQRANNGLARANKGAETQQNDEAANKGGL